MPANGRWDLIRRLKVKKVNVVTWQYDEADVILPVVTPHDDHDDNGKVRMKTGNTRKVRCVIIVTEVQNFSDS